MRYATGMRKFSLIALVATLCLCQDASDPWTKSEVLEPSVLANLVNDPKPPTVLCVAFPVLYKLKHISHDTLELIDFALDYVGVLDRIETIAHSFP